MARAASGPKGRVSNQCITAFRRSRLWCCRRWHCPTNPPTRSCRRPHGAGAVRCVRTICYVIDMVLGRPGWRRSPFLQPNWRRWKQPDRWRSPFRLPTLTLPACLRIAKRRRSRRYYPPWPAALRCRAFGAVRCLIGGVFRCVAHVTNPVGRARGIGTGVRAGIGRSRCVLVLTRRIDGRVGVRHRAGRHAADATHTAADRSTAAAANTADKTPGLGRHDQPPHRTAKRPSLLSSGIHAFGSSYMRKAGAARAQPFTARRGKRLRGEVASPLPRKDCRTTTEHTRRLRVSHCPVAASGG